jgi:hypothetical protein
MAKAAEYKILGQQATGQGSMRWAEAFMPCNGHQITSVFGSSGDPRSLKTS